MAAAASPAVIINNIPSHIKRNGQTMSEVVLGSKTGKEVGVAFWKIHQTDPKFMVVFKHLTDRDTWVRTSTFLQETMAKHGLEVTRVIIICQYDTKILTTDLFTYGVYIYLRKYRS